MSTRTIVAIIAFCIMMSGVIMGNLAVTIMIGEINRKRPEENLVSYFGYSPDKGLAIYREYRSLYPDGRVHLQFWTAVALACIGLISYLIILFSSG